VILDHGANGSHICFQRISFGSMAVNVKGAKENATGLAACGVNVGER
jgi:hypothetical protein